MTLQQRIEAIVEQPVRSIRPLHGGMIGEVRQIDLANGDRLVAKTASSPDAQLEREGFMLRYLSEHSSLPVPTVIHSEPTLLLMTFVEGNSSFNHNAEQHAAKLLTDLHNVTAPQFGLEQDTLIGSLHQPNPWTDAWVPFFRDQRLLYMADVAHEGWALATDGSRAH
jgi:fructosamine-3-kinase